MRRKREIKAKVGKSILRVKEKVKNMPDKETEGDGKSESQSREGTKMREQKRVDMISMECLLTVLCGPGLWDK